MSKLEAKFLHSKANMATFEFETQLLEAKSFSLGVKVKALDDEIKMNNTKVKIAKVTTNIKVDSDIN